MKITNTLPAPSGGEWGTKKIPKRCYHLHSPGTGSWNLYSAPIPPFASPVCCRPQGKSYLYFTQFEAEVQGAKIESAMAYVSIPGGQRGHPMWTPTLQTLGDRWRRRSWDSEDKFVTWGIQGVGARLTPENCCGTGQEVGA